MPVRSRNSSRLGIVPSLSVSTERGQFAQMISSETVPPPPPPALPAGLVEHAARNDEAPVVPAIWRSFLRDIPARFGWLLCDLNEFMWVPSTAIVLVP